MAWARASNIDHIQNGKAKMKAAPADPSTHRKRIDPITIIQIPREVAPA